MYCCYYCCSLKFALKALTNCGRQSLDKTKMMMQQLTYSTHVRVSTSWRNRRCRRSLVLHAECSCYKLTSPCAATTNQPRLAAKCKVQSMVLHSAHNQINTNFQNAPEMRKVAELQRQIEKIEKNRKSFFSFVDAKTKTWNKQNSD